MTATDDRPLSGKDLARQALLAARAAAAARPNQPTRRKPTPRRRTRSAGRDPMPLGGIVTDLNQAYEWNVSLDGGTLHDRWARVCPELVGKVAPEHYDPGTRTLHLRPASHAYGAQLRLLGGQLAKRLNDAVGQQVVARIRVLPPGALPQATPRQVPDRPASGPQNAAPRTRDEASPGYHRALAAARETRPQPAESPDAQAADRYFADIRSTLREPTEAFTKAAHSSDGPTAAGVEDARQRALARARAEKAGAGPVPPRAFGAA